MEILDKLLEKFEINKKISPSDLYSKDSKHVQG